MEMKFFFGFANAFQTISLSYQSFIYSPTDALVSWLKRQY